MGLIRAGVVGAGGYVGGELCRWLLGHPEARLCKVFGKTSAGKHLSELHPALSGLVDLAVQPISEVHDVDVLFVATPHGVSADLDLPAVPLVIDLSADHRHADGWVYGLCEWADLMGAERVAVPGCFASAIELALAPIAQWLPDRVQVAAITGSTGSGATPSAGTHHPERFANVRAYKALAHQHVPEVQQFLGGLGASVAVDLVPMSGPFDRGIYATVFARIPADHDVASAFADAYADAPLVRLRKEPPELRFVRGTAFCDLSVHRDADTVVVLSAIDNLGRGAAAQAIQCMNQALGLPAAIGLRAAGAIP